MSALFIFAGIELAALVLLVMLIMAAPEATEDEHGFRVVGPSLWQRLRTKWMPPPPPAPPQPKVPPFPSVHGPRHA